MKIKVALIIIVIVCVGLAIALFSIKKTAEDQHETDIQKTVEYSNEVVTANQHVTELGQVNLTLSNDLASSQQQITSDAAQMTQLSNSLASANTALSDTKSSLATAQEQVTNLNARISDLEAQNKVLDDQAQSLSNRIVELTSQIEDTKTKLAIALTNADFLQGELQKQMVARAELEHKFNNLDELRAQVRKVKDEMFVARREQLNKYDSGTKHGGELLIQRTLVAPPSKSHAQSSSNYDLNVEVGSDGSVKVIPPLGNTNSPSH